MSHLTSTSSSMSPRLLPRATRRLAVFLLTLSLPFSPGHATTVIEDPMQAQANSFGWLAIRNVTYCLSSQPDPPNKPRGIQPKSPQLVSTNSHATGTGDSVVVLYHPENTNRAIAWCNTLVAFQDTEHVKCRVALPTCQRCDAVRNTSTEAVQGDRGMLAGTLLLKSDRSSVPARKMRRRGSTGTGRTARQRRTPGDRLSPLPGNPKIETDKQRTSQPDKHAPIRSPRPFGSPSMPVHDDASSDPELEAAISEFQDYCENKLTLAVRADCPLHIVQSWSDEPPFDLHRFCMSLQGPPKTSTRHTSGGDSLEAASKTEKPDGKADITAGDKAEKSKDEGSAGGGGGNGLKKGAFDPNDPVVPIPDAKGAP